MDIETALAVDKHMQDYDERQPNYVFCELAEGIDNITVTQKAWIEAGAVLLCRMRRQPDSFSPSEFAQLQKYLKGIDDIKRGQVWSEKYGGME